MAISRVGVQATRLGESELARTQSVIGWSGSEKWPPQLDCKDSLETTSMSGVSELRLLPRYSLAVFLRWHLCRGDAGHVDCSPEAD